MRKTILTLTLIAMVIAVSGCGSNANQYQAVINPEFLEMSKEEVFERGEALFEERSWSKAREHYAYVYETYPNDPLGRRSLLRIADTYFEAGGSINLVEAQYKYRDFINRYPGSDFADYAMLQIALVSFREMEGPERDQSKTREAVQKLREMVSLYPNSEYRPVAEEKLREALDRLARSEHLVARFYMNRDAWRASINRLNALLEDFPDYSARDEAFYDLAVSLAGLGREGEAKLWLERVITEFPESDTAARAKEKLRDIEA
ncbi:MAG: outer membrane protein assembly factor BamD [Thermoanaerobaculia bacterium]|nr:outer membrane protein assembly factor BamD [Thermoanaerobaculia bacterium]